MAQKRWQEDRPNRDASRNSGSQRWQGSVGGFSSLFRRRWMRVSAYLFVLGSILSIIAIITLYVLPVPAPAVVLISSQYAGPTLLPPNPCIANDRQLFSDNSKHFNDGQVASVPWNESSFDSIGKVNPKRFWQLFGKSTLIVYVNAIGIAEGSPAAKKAYLLPETFDPSMWATQSSEAREKLRVKALLDAIDRNSADQKILVLDCRKIDHLWPIGMIDNPFVETVKSELTAHQSEAKSKIQVIFSSKDEGLSGSIGEKGTSQFAEAFISALTSAKEKNDVTLGELFIAINNSMTPKAGKTSESGAAGKTAESKLTRWPTAEPGESDTWSSMYVIKHSGPSSTVTKTELTENQLDAHIKEITDKWSDYAKAVNRSPALNLWSKPAALRAIEDRLLHAESALLAREPLLMKKDVEEAADLIKSLVPAAPSAGDVVGRKRQALRQELRVTLSQISQPLESLLPELAIQSEGPAVKTEADTAAKKAPQTVEALFENAFRSWTDKAPAHAAKSKELLTSLIGLRKSAEAVAVCCRWQTPFLPEHFHQQWSELDRRRRLIEDLYFAGNQPEYWVPVGNANPSKLFEAQPANLEAEIKRTSEGYKSLQAQAQQWMTAARWQKTVQLRLQKYADIVANNMALSDIEFKQLCDYASRSLSNDWEQTELESKAAQLEKSMKKLSEAAPLALPPTAITEMLLRAEQPVDAGQWNAMVKARSKSLQNAYQERWVSSVAEAAHVRQTYASLDQTIAAVLQAKSPTDSDRQAQKGTKPSAGKTDEKPSTIENSFASVRRLAQEDAGESGEFARRLHPGLDSANKADQWTHDAKLRMFLDQRYAKRLADDHWKLTVDNVNQTISSYTLAAECSKAAEKLASLDAPTARRSQASEATSGNQQPWSAWKSKDPIESVVTPANGGDQKLRWQNKWNWSVDWTTKDPLARDALLGLASVTYQASSGKELTPNLTLSSKPSTGPGGSNQREFELAIDLQRAANLTALKTLDQSQLFKFSADSFFRGRIASQANTSMTTPEYAAPPTVAIDRSQLLKPNLSVRKEVLPPAEVYFLIDCSGSMREKLDPRESATRMDVLQSVLGDFWMIYRNLDRANKPKWHIRCFGRGYVNTPGEINYNAKPPDSYMLDVDPDFGDFTEESIKRAKPNGATPLYYAVKSTLDKIGSKSDAVLIVIGDGDDITVEWFSHAEKQREANPELEKTIKGYFSDYPTEEAIRRKCRESKLKAITYINVARDVSNSKAEQVFKSDGNSRSKYLSTSDKVTLVNYLEKAVGINHYQLSIQSRNDSQWEPINLSSDGAAQQFAAPRSGYFALKAEEAGSGPRFPDDDSFFLLQPGEWHELIFKQNRWVPQLPLNALQLANPLMTANATSDMIETRLNWDMGQPNDAVLWLDVRKKPAATGASDSNWRPKNVVMVIESAGERTSGSSEAVVWGSILHAPGERNRGPWFSAELKLSKAGAASLREKFENAKVRVFVDQSSAVPEQEVDLSEFRRNDFRIYKESSVIESMRFENDRTVTVRLNWNNASAGKAANEEEFYWVDVIKSEGNDSQAVPENCIQSATYRYNLKERTAMAEFKLQPDVRTKLRLYKTKGKPAFVGNVGG